ncbi:ESPR-type extended signal peptide-containing protein, partial [Acinetobacter higginsii]|uniref:ESPR-type extended signal peptide-containing protein n=1 Tax=Acinetobacter higginsii TaxID=70347 RepID=UPI002676E9CC
MNKVYKVVWNASLGVWVAVSELAKTKTKKSGSVGQVACLDLQEQQNSLAKLFNYKALSVAIFTVFTTTFAFAGYEGGNGSTRTNCTATSAGTGGEATGAIAIGSDSGQTCAKGTDAVAIGRAAVATGTGAVVLGPSSVAGEAYTTAIGNNAQAMSRGSVAIGSGAYADSKENTLDGKGAVAIGNDASALGKNSYALGAESSVVEDDTVSFGHAAGDDRYYSGTKSGTWATNRFMRLTNVANGYKANDATNVSQLNQVAAILGSTGIDAAAKTGTVALPSYVINKTDGTTYAAATTVPQAISNLNTEVLKSLGFVGDSGTKATRKLGEDLNVKGGATGTLTSGNIGVVSNGSNQLDIKLAETVNLGTNGSVTTGNTKINNSGLTITGGPSVTTTGINAGSKVITNVADGAATTDAVNKGQLDTVSTQANKAITFTGNARKSGDTKDVDRKLGETIAISGAASTAGTYSGANVKTVTDQTGAIAIQIADAPNFAGTVTSTGQQVNGNSVVTGSSTIGSGGNAVTLTGTVGGKKITNVAAPTVGSDATNKTYVDGKVQTLADNPLGFVGDSGTKATRKLGEDLNVKGGATGTLTNGNIGVVSNGSNQLDIKLAETVNLGTNGSVTTGNSKIDNSGLTITGGPSVTTTGINAGSKVITNVAAGAAATDAVNKGQLDTVSTQANKAITFTGNARKSGDTTDVDRKLGETIAISGAASTAGTYSGANVKTVTDQTGAIAIQIADAPNFAGTVTSTGQQVNGNSVVTGSSTIGSGGNAVTLTGTANGLDVGGKKITNVAAPTVGSDATNKTYVDGKVQTLADNPLGFVGDSGTKATRKLGEDLNVKGGATGTLTNGNIGVVSNGSNQLDIKLAETVNLGTNGSVTTGNTVINNAGVTADKVTVGGVVIDKTTGINAGSQKITNVTAGTATTDAVNKGQLDTVSTQANKAITFTGNARKSGDTTDVDRKLGESIAISGAASTAGTYSGANVKTVTDQTGAIAIQIADAPNFAGTVTSTGQQVNGNSVVTGSSTIGSGANAVTLTGTANGLDVGGKKITNVKAGAVNASSTDAINGSQLFNTANNAKNIIGGNTTIDATTGAITTSNIGGTGSNTIDGAITSVKATTDKGINFGGTTGKNNYALGSDINVKGDSNITSTTVAGGVQLGLGDTLNVKDAINVGSGATKVKIDGTTNTIGGLSNTTWNGTAV